MNSFSAPLIAASLAAVTALPLNFAVTGTLLLGAALGSIVHADYVRRHKRLRLAGLVDAASVRLASTRSDAESHPLAA